MSFNQEQCSLRCGNGTPVLRQLEIEDVHTQAVIAGPRSGMTANEVGYSKL
jgi:hypothetical protein